MRPLNLAAGQIVPHPAWSAACGALLKTLRAGPGVHALLGPPGTGKTLLLHELGRALRAEDQDVLLLPRGDQPATAPDGTILLIDEADRMEAEALAALMARPDLRLVLAALPAFSARLPGVPTVTLAPLPPDEAASFLRARVAQSGHAPDLLTNGAVDAIVHHAAGAPRVLNALLGMAVFSASLDGEERVTAAHVAQAMQFRDLDAEAEAPPLPPPAPPDPVAEPDPAAPPAPAPPVPVRRRWAMALLLLLLLGVAGAAAALLRPVTRGPAPAPATASVPAPIEPAQPSPAETPPAAPPAPAAEAAALPPRSIPRVVLTYLRGDVEAARQGQEVARILRAAGITAGDPVPVGRRPDGTALQYFFMQDRDGAAEIARQLGGRFGDGALAPPARREPLPRPGTVEILLVPD